MAAGPMFRSSRGKAGSASWWSIRAARSSPGLQRRRSAGRRLPCKRRRASLRENALRAASGRGRSWGVYRRSFVRAANLPPTPSKPLVVSLVARRMALNPSAVSCVLHRVVQSARAPFHRDFLIAFHKRFGTDSDEPGSLPLQSGLAAGIEFASPLTLSSPPLSQGSASPAR